ncbi:hypothetical protein MT997_08770 [Paenibacillus sp. OVF10]|nr:hypothetical protein MT997_08770 [Paenibacillus sp. OVF10]
MNGRMLVVDDEALFRQGLIHLVRNNPSGGRSLGKRPMEKKRYRLYTAAHLI